MHLVNLVASLDVSNATNISMSFLHIIYSLKIGVTSGIRTHGFQVLQTCALDHSAIVTWYQQVVTLHPNQPYESRSCTCTAGIGASNRREMVGAVGLEPTLEGF